MRVVGVEPDESADDLPAEYWEACRLAEQGQFDQARRLYGEVESLAVADSRLGLLIRNDLAVLAALEGRLDEASRAWRELIEVAPGIPIGRLNDALVASELNRLSLRRSEDFAPLKLAPAPGMAGAFESAPRSPSSADHSSPRVAVLSFLFNWPSTGGGNMHTAGLARFLGRAGYEVRHIFARFPNWGIGRVADELLCPADVIEFDASAWNVDEIQARYRRAVDAFGPDYVVITDAWNMKPLLAEAVRGYPYFLLVQAQESLCPLNNLRLLASGPEQVEQCPRNYLATPEICHRCLAERGHHAGALHLVERALAGVGTPEYDRKLRASLRDAEAVLALNPLTAAMLEPFASRVRVVPWGIDAERFPWSAPESEAFEPSAKGMLAENGDRHPARGSLAPERTPGEGPRASPRFPSPVESEGTAVRDPSASRPRAVVFMAAVAGEFIKGFHVAHEACRLLRQARDDFELVVTFDPPGAGPIDEFTRSVGWCSQAELPRHYREADICLVPTIAQDGLSITSVEAMASGVPVVASRIGGLPYTVSDGLTGLLFEPGDPADLARPIARLLDDPDLRRRMGLAGRKRFEEEFTWETVIERHWRPLLSTRVASVGRNGSGTLHPPFGHPLSAPRGEGEEARSAGYFRGLGHAKQGCSFDIAPFLQPDDPWLVTEEPALVRRLYAEKYDVAAMLRPQSIVEIGVRAGYSAAAFLSAVPGCTYLGLDLDQAMYGGWPGALDRARIMLRELFGDRAEVSARDTRQMDVLPCGPVDLVHVDGDHSYEGCLHDLRLAAKVARWILVDDLEWLVPVRAAVTAFLAETRYRAIELSSVRGDMLIELRQEEKTFSHGGDTGDLIYALPTVKMLGGGRLRLVKAQQVREPFSPAKVESLRPLLEAQPYVTGVEYGEEAAGLDLDAFRKLYRDDLNLSDLVSTTFGIPHYPREEPWLFCSEPKSVARVVISRSPRYHGHRFPWHRVREKYGTDAVFVGLPEEHAAWRDAFGPISYYPTPDWWELCRVVAGSQIFCGNQSAPMAIALGLCVPRIVQEVCPSTPNCHFERPGVEYGRDENVELPD
jgi:glycosyltransferase involved in cell wall biosynthesis